jgi:hypothetical protein
MSSLVSLFIKDEYFLQNYIIFFDLPTIYRQSFHLSAVLSAVFGLSAVLSAVFSLSAVLSAVPDFKGSDKINCGSGLHESGAAAMIILHVLHSDIQYRDDAFYTEGQE